MSVKPVGDYDPKRMEEEVLGYWAKHDIMQATLRPRKEKLFSFLEGPPTANAPPALHHVEVRTFKDIVNRFHYMLGESVPRMAGWDCHGLPVEVQVEKELNLSTKKDILEYGLDRFVEKCKASVFSHIKEWDDLTKRMAYWVDLKSPYVTMEDDYIESVWWSLKELWKKGLLYEGHRVVPYCARCGTPLSSHEVSLGYQSVKEETVIVSFRAAEEDYSLLAWTTTPWTLLSNLALAVNPKVKYAVIKYRGEKYVLAKELAQKRFPEADIVEELDGKKLVGVKYHPLFGHFKGKLEKPAWYVLPGDFVTTEEGTGIVHIAPAFGEDDYNAGKENGLPLVNPIDQEGKFTEDVPELAGLFAKDADEKIIDWLNDMGALIAKYPYEHEYPHCWRCKTPLLYYAMKSWFIKVSDVVSDLVSQNKKIKWYPPSIGSGRFGNWVENARDWNLSRNRFWGTPLPIWVCECGKNKVIGSRRELEEEAQGNVPKKIELHRPYVDEVMLGCSCGKQMRRVEYVIDCWYDSGAATFAQYHYPFENEELFKEAFPYDFICEATDQTRGWFYTLLVLSTILFKEPAYGSCVVGGLLLDDRGEKMSKSNDNIIDPWELFDSVGADAVRLQMCCTAPWNTKRFGKDSMRESVIPMLRTLWNCYSFTVRYMLLDGFDPKEHELADDELALEDRWVLSAAARLEETVKERLLANEYHHTLAALDDFIVEDLSRWYIKLIRDRLWLEDEKGKMNPSKKAAYMSLASALKSVCTCLAPLAPFISEEIFLNLLAGEEESIHHVSWPEQGQVDAALMDDMRLGRRICEAGAACRQDAQIKLRYPIAKVTVAGDDSVRKAIANVMEVLIKQLNTKKIEHVEKLPEVSYVAVPDYSVIGPAYGGDADKVAKAIKENPLAAKKIKESGKKAQISGYDVEPGMVAKVTIEVPDNYAASSFSDGKSHGVVLIETRRSQSLLNEALARDLIRNIQEARKRMGLEELDRIRVEVTGSNEVEEMLKEFTDLVLKEVRADSLDLVDKLATKDSFKYEDKAIHYRISR